MIFPIMYVFLKGQPYVSEYYMGIISAESKRLSALAEKKESKSKPRSGGSTSGWKRKVKISFVSP